MGQLVESGAMNPTKEVFDRNIHKCLRCPHVWMSRKGARPERCPNCNSTLWDSAKEQKRGPAPGTKQRPRKSGKAHTRARKGK